MNEITVIIPVSPMPSHPSSEILDQTVASVRERLPDSEIIIAFDGVAPNKMEMKANYEEYKQHALWQCEHEYGNCTPIVAPAHVHQSGLMKAALKLVRTKTVLWLEQDTPLHNEIPFDKLVPVITTGYANVIRFHHEASVHPEHEYLMLDKEPIDILGVPFLRSYQWSGRPHLASATYYQWLVDTMWRDQMFIEHFMYGIVVDGEYDLHRLHIYAPEGTLVRSLHLDGRRKGAENYDPTPS